MFEKAAGTVKKYNMIKKGERIIVGVSGGADSLCLLYFLCGIAKELDIKLLVIHVNHGLRGREADDDEAYVKGVCEGLGVPFFPYHISLYNEAKERAMTEEEAGRAVRYEIFKNAAEEYNADKVAVAHTMNDSAETILMNLCRGTGINGLGGISPVRGSIIRPLIEMSREEVEQTLNALGVSYRTDSTNKSLKYTRNRVRLELIPWLKENMNRSVVRVLSKNAAVISEENSYIEKTAQQAYKECIVEDKLIRLSCERLKELDSVILKRVLRIACRNFNRELHDIGNDHIERAAGLLNMQTGKKIGLPDCLYAQRTYDSIIIYRQEEKHIGFCYPLERESALFVAETGQYITLGTKRSTSFKNCKNTYTIYLDCDKIKNRLFVRSRKIGDKIHLKGMNGYKKIKNLFIDMKIPAVKRDLIPLLADENEIISVLGIKNSDVFAVGNEGENTICLQLWEDNENEGDN